MHVYTLFLIDRRAIVCCANEKVSPCAGAWNVCQRVGHWDKDHVVWLIHPKRVYQHSWHMLPSRGKVSIHSIGSVLTNPHGYAQSHCRVMGECRYTQKGCIDTTNTVTKPPIWTDFGKILRFGQFQSGQKGVNFQVQPFPLSGHVWPPT